MTYEDEDEVPPLAETWEAPPELNDLTRRVIGAAMEVHEELGPGLPEQAYQKAFELELTARGISFQAQCPVEITYKGTPVCSGRIDLLVEGQLVVEIKSIEALAPIHKGIGTRISLPNQTPSRPFNQFQCQRAEGRPSPRHSLMIFSATSAPLRALRSHLISLHGPRKSCR